MKCCLFKSCKNYFKSKNYVSLGIYFIPIPKPTIDLNKCKTWLEAVGRSDITYRNVNRHHYVCSKHFVGGDGPTEDFPDPVPEKQLNKKISRFNHSEHSYARGSREININVAQVKAKVKENNETLDDCFQNKEENAPIVAANFLIDSNDNVTERKTMHGARNLCHNEHNNENLNDEPGSSESILNAEVTTSFSEIENLARSYFSYQTENITCSWNLIVDKLNSEINGLSFVKTRNETISIKIKLTTSLELDLVVYNQSLNNEHKVYHSGNLTSRVRVTRINDLLKIMLELDKWTICEGVTGDLSKHFQTKSLKAAFYCQSSDALKSRKCELVFLSHQTKLCAECRQVKKSLLMRVKNEKANKKVECKTNKGAVNKRVAALRLKNSALKRTVTSLEKKIQKHGVEEGKDFEKLLTLHPFDCKNTFQEILLREQIRIQRSNISRPKKWHLAIIRWCLYMKAKSPTSYKALKQTMVLPSKMTLCNYSREFRTWKKWF